MSDKCPGNGTCLTQDQHPIWCQIFKYFGSCICCKHKCRPERCLNYRLCEQTQPEWILDQYNGCCFNCFTTVGKLEFLDGVTEECGICFEETTMVRIFCGHKLCLNCWIERVKYKVECPFCLRKPSDVNSVWVFEIPTNVYNLSHHRN